MTRKYNPQFEKIGTILVYENVITEDQLNSALSEQKNSGGKLGGVLLSNALVTEDELVNAYSLQLGHRAVTEDELLKANEDYYVRKKNGMSVIRNMFLTAISIFSQAISNFIRLIFGFPEFRFESTELFSWARKNKRAFMSRIFF